MKRSKKDKSISNRFYQIWIQESFFFIDLNFPPFWVYDIIIFWINEKRNQGSTYYALVFSSSELRNLANSS